MSTQDNNEKDIKEVKKVSLAELVKRKLESQKQQQQQKESSFSTTNNSNKKFASQQTKKSAAAHRARTGE